jgi:hypothetical protein
MSRSDVAPTAPSPQAAIPACTHKDARCARCGECWARKCCRCDGRAGPRAYARRQRDSTVLARQHGQELTNAPAAGSSPAPADSPAPAPTSPQCPPSHSKHGWCKAHGACKRHCACHAAAAEESTGRQSSEKAPRGIKPAWTPYPL